MSRLLNIGSLGLPPTSSWLTTPAMGADHPCFMSEGGGPEQDDGFTFSLSPSGTVLTATKTVPFRNHPYFASTIHPEVLDQAADLQGVKWSLDRASIHRNLFWSGGENFDAGQLLRDLEQDQRLRQLYDGISVVDEGYTLRRHTSMVQSVFETFFAHRFGRRLPGGVGKGFFRLLLALHDIGKPRAIAMDRRDLEHDFTWPIVESVLLQLGFSTRERDIARCLIDPDLMGPYLLSRRMRVNLSDKTDARYKRMVRHRLHLEDYQLADVEAYYERSGGQAWGRNLERHARANARRDLRSVAAFAGMSPKDFFDLMTLYFMCDLGSYTTAMGGVTDFADSYFDIRPDEKYFGWSELYQDHYRRLRERVMEDDAVVSASNLHEGTGAGVVQTSDDLRARVSRFAGRRVLYIGCGYSAQDIAEIMKWGRHSPNELYIGVDPLLLRDHPSPETLLRSLSGNVLLAPQSAREVLSGMQNEIDVIHIVAPYGGADHPQMNSTLRREDAIMVYQALRQGGHLDLHTEMRSWWEDYLQALRQTFDHVDGGVLSPEDSLAPYSTHMQGRWEDIDRIYRILAFKK